MSKNVFHIFAVSLGVVLILFGLSIDYVPPGDPYLKQATELPVPQVEDTLSFEMTVLDKYALPHEYHVQVMYDSASAVRWNTDPLQRSYQKHIEREIKMILHVETRYLERTGRQGTIHEGDTIYDTSVIERRIEFINCYPTNGIILTHLEPNVGPNRRGKTVSTYIEML